MANNNPTSTGIGQGTAQVFDFSNVSQQYQKGLDQQAKIAIQKKEKGDQIYAAALKGLGDLTVGKIFYKQLPEFEKMKKDAADYLQKNAVAYMNNDPNVIGNYNNMLSNFQLRAKLSEQTAEDVKEKIKFKREHPEVDVGGNAEFEDWINNKAYDPKTGTSNFEVPNLFLKKHIDPIEFEKGLLNLVTYDESETKGIAKGMGGVYNTEKYSKTPKLEAVRTALANGYATNPSTREYLESNWNGVPEDEKKKLIASGIDNPVEYQVNKVGEAAGTVKRSGSSGFSRDPQSVGNANALLNSISEGNSVTVNIPGMSGNMVNKEQVFLASAGANMEKKIISSGQDVRDINTGERLSNTAKNVYGEFSEMAIGYFWPEGTRGKNAKGETIDLGGKPVSKEAMGKNYKPENRPVAKVMMYGLAYDPVMEEVKDNATGKMVKQQKIDDEGKPVYTTRGISAPADKTVSQEDNLVLKAEFDKRAKAYNASRGATQTQNTANVKNKPRSAQ